MGIGGSLGTGGFFYEPIVSSLGVGSTNVPRVHPPCLVNQMELLGHDFFLFTDADTDRLNLLYRRKDGNYGLIEAQRG